MLYTLYYLLMMIHICVLIFQIERMSLTSGPMRFYLFSLRARRIGHWVERVQTEITGHKLLERVQTEITGHKLLEVVKSDMICPDSNLTRSNFF
jgi:hypothetical protein